jgi:hypothetical protein
MPYKKAVTNTVFRNAARGSLMPPEAEDVVGPKLERSFSVIVHKKTRPASMVMRSADAKAVHMNRSFAAFNM